MQYNSIKCFETAKITYFGLMPSNRAHIDLENKIISFFRKYVCIYKWNTHMFLYCPIFALYAIFKRSDKKVKIKKLIKIKVVIINQYMY